MAIDLDHVADLVATRLGRTAGAGAEVRAYVEAAAELAAGYISDPDDPLGTDELPDSALVEQGLVVLATRLAADSNPAAVDAGITTPADLLTHVHHYFDAVRDDAAWGLA